MENDKRNVMDWLNDMAHDEKWPCYYSDSEVQTLAKDALELLKAREPHYTRLEYLVNGQLVAIHHPECPRCFENGLILWDAEIKKGQAYCHRCGQAVKWND